MSLTAPMSRPEGLPLLIRGQPSPCPAPIEDLADVAENIVSYVFAGEVKQKLLTGTGRRWMRLKGLKKDGIYMVDGQEYPGDVLMNGGLLLPRLR